MGFCPWKTFVWVWNLTSCYMSKCLSMFTLPSVWNLTMFKNACWQTLQKFKCQPFFLTNGLKRNIKTVLTDQWPLPPSPSRSRLLTYERSLAVIADIAFKTEFATSTVFTPNLLINRLYLIISALKTNSNFNAGSSSIA